MIIRVTQTRKKISLPLTIMMRPHLRDGSNKSLSSPTSHLSRLVLMTVSQIISSNKYRPIQRSRETQENNHEELLVSHKTSFVMVIWLLLRLQDFMRMKAPKRMKTEAILSISIKFSWKIEQTYLPERHYILTPCANSASSKISFHRMTSSCQDRIRNRSTLRSFQCFRT